MVELGHIAGTHLDFMLYMYLQRLWTQSSERSLLWWLWLSYKLEKFAIIATYKQKAVYIISTFGKVFVKRSLPWRLFEKVICFTSELWNFVTMAICEESLTWLGCHHDQLWERYFRKRIVNVTAFQNSVTMNGDLSEGLLPSQVFFRKIVYCNEGGHHDNLFVKAVRMMTNTCFKEIVCWAAETRLASESSPDSKVHGAPGSCRPQMGPMLAPWTLLSGRFVDVAVGI